MVVKCPAQKVVSLISEQTLRVNANISSCFFSVKAGEYLQEIDETLFRDIAKSGLVGILQRNADVPCQEAFPAALAACSRTNNATVPHQESAYRHPAPTCRQKDEHLDVFSQNLREIIVGL